MEGVKRVRMSFCRILDTHLDTLKRKSRVNCGFQLVNSARNRTRTCTSLRILVPETSASTNSAIRAFCDIQHKSNKANLLLPGAQDKT